MVCTVYSVYWVPVEQLKQNFSFTVDSYRDFILSIVFFSFFFSSIFIWFFLVGKYRWKFLRGLSRTVDKMGGKS